MKIGKKSGVNIYMLRIWYVGASAALPSLCERILILISVETPETGCQSNVISP